MSKPARYVVDPNDPRAPSQAEWDRLNDDERRRIVDALPSEIFLPPEGDVHQRAKTRAHQALEEHFGRVRRQIYLAAELPVYYPGEAMFAPDLIAVRDVDKRDRLSWIVSAEARGIDLALEIHVAGDARKDFETNVEKYARLGIPEYFAFDAVRARLAGWRLPNPGARRYEPIVPQGGRWSSQVLELDLTPERGRLRFMVGAAVLLDAHELVSELSRLLDDAMKRAGQEAQRAEQEAQRAEQEAQRAEREAQRAERLAAKLRALGVDPDSE